MLALTLQQPWATAVAEFGKDIENRSWRPPSRVIGQRIAIHAGRVFDEPGARWILERNLAPGCTIGQLWMAPRGYIVATAIVLSVRVDSGSPWFHGPVGWELREVRRLSPPVLARGAQGLWRLSPADADRVLAAQLPLEGALDG